MVPEFCIYRLPWNKSQSILCENNMSRNLLPFVFILSLNNSLLFSLSISVPNHLLHKFIIYILLLLLFDIILVFRFQSSIGIFGFARRFSDESIPNISLSPPVESHVTAPRVEGNKCVTKFVSQIQKCWCSRWLDC